VESPSRRGLLCLGFWFLNPSACQVCLHCIVYHVISYSCLAFCLRNHIFSLLVCDWLHSVWTKSLVCKDAVLQGISLFRRVLEDSAVRKVGSLSTVRTIVPSRLDAHLSTVPSVQKTCHTVRTPRQTLHHSSR
jgi:hypothetical protein